MREKLGYEKKEEDELPVAKLRSTHDLLPLSTHSLHKKCNINIKYIYGWNINMLSYLS